MTRLRRGLLATVLAGVLGTQGVAALASLAREVAATPLAARARALTATPAERRAAALGEAAALSAAVERHVPPGARVFVLVRVEDAAGPLRAEALLFPRRLAWFAVPPHGDVADPEGGPPPPLPPGAFALDVESGLNWALHRVAEVVDAGPGYRLWRATEPPR